MKKVLLHKYKPRYTIIHRENNIIKLNNCRNNGEDINSVFLYCANNNTTQQKNFENLLTS